MAALQNGRLAGFGVLRLCRQRHKIGPLFAGSPDLAEKLFQGLAVALGQDVFMDTPETNPTAVALLRPTL